MTAPAPRTNPDGDALLSTQQVAEQWGTSRRFVELRIADGTLAAVRIGRRLLRVRQSDADAALRPLPTVPALRRGRAL